MGRLIDTEHLKKRATDLLGDCWDNYAQSTEDFLEYIDNEPTVDVVEEVCNIVHNVILGFFDVCDDDEEVPMSEKDKLLLKVNKAICNRIRLWGEREDANK